MNKMPKVMFLNGPPQCGKDTAGLALLAYDGWMNNRIKLLAFKTPIIDFFTKIMGYDLSNYEQMKNEQLPGAGCTLREAMINFSEKYMKKQFDSFVFGDIALRQMQMSPNVDLFVFTDSGFIEEAVPIVNYAGTNNCMTVQIHREGKDFSGDSRSYWTMLGVERVRVTNDDLTKFRNKIRALASSFLGD